MKKKTDLNVEVLDVKYNALGNMMSVNDTGGIVSPSFPKESLRKISDVLDIEVIQKKIAGFHQVGAVMAISPIGGIVHPETDDEDIKVIKNITEDYIETTDGARYYYGYRIASNVDDENLIFGDSVHIYNIFNIRSNH